MRVVIACERSGRLRTAFRLRGHDAWSCDTEPAEDNGQHLRCDIRLALQQDWDLMIAHPECRHLSVSGARYFKAKAADGSQQQAIDFFMMLAQAPVQKIAIENPVGIMSTRWRKPDQIIQPWQFGDDASKATCLWLKGLPLLSLGVMVAPRMVGTKKRWANQTNSGQNRLGPSPTRSFERARTYPGIAKAMAEQWG